MAESLLVGRNFVSGICKLKPKKTFDVTLKTKKNYFGGKTLGFYQPWEKYADKQKPVRQ